MPVISPSKTWLIFTEICFSKDSKLSPLSVPQIVFSALTAVQFIIIASVSVRVPKEDVYLHPDLDFWT